MKTRNLFLLILALTFTLNVYAGKKPEMNVTILKNSKALVALEQSSPEKTTISFESGNGDIVYYKESFTQNNNFQTLLDLSELDNGTYYVKAQAGNTVIKSEITLKNGVVSVKPAKQKTGPHFVLGDKSLRVSYLNLENRSYRFLLYQNGELIYSFDMGHETDMQKLFDFNWLDKGNYNVSLASEGDEYLYPLCLK